MLVEITEMRLAGGVADDAFLAADRRVQAEVFPFQRGFLRRTTARGDDGWWAVVVLWDSVDDADAAAAGPRHPAAVELQGLLDPESARTRRYTTLD